MKRRRLLVVGAGGHGRSIAEAAELSGQFDVVGFLDDALPSGATVVGTSVLGPVERMVDLHETCALAIVAIGNNTARERLIQQLLQARYELASVIHPRACVSPSALVGAGAAVMAGAVVGTEARMGMGVIVNCGAVVDHHAVVEDFGHLGVNACMAGGTVLGRGAWMQAGSVLGYGVHVPPAAVLAPGQAFIAGASS